eukprot:GHVT01072623.1.p1 GENE.GHVT01072623.1~~GHVT01072623.1.p1  ORF type:complete len:450 (+),score=111.65 GHVT01072623.1:242-1591(+)
MALPHSLLGRVGVHFVALLVVVVAVEGGGLRGAHCRRAPALVGGRGLQRRYFPPRGAADAFAPPAGRAGVKRRLEPKNFNGSSNAPAGAAGRCVGGERHSLGSTVGSNDTFKTFRKVPVAFFPFFQRRRRAKASKRWLGLPWPRRAFNFSAPSPSKDPTDQIASEPLRVSAGPPEVAQEPESNELRGDADDEESSKSPARDDSSEIFSPPADSSSPSLFPSSASPLAAGSSLASSYFTALPPLTRLYISAALAMAIASYFFNHNVFPHSLRLNWSAVCLQGQAWRLFSSFLYLGPLSVSYFLTLHFLATYMSSLERMHCLDPGKFVMLLLFGMAGVALTSAALGTSSDSLGHALSSYLVYLWSRANEGLDVTLLELVTAKAELLPWAFVLQAALFDRQIPLTDLGAIAVGALAHSLHKHRNFRLPGVLQRIANHKRIASMYKPFADALQ